MPRLTAAIVILGVLGVGYALLRPIIDPPRSVRLGEVRPAAPGEVSQGESLTAPGWIEAAPYPITVRPLVKGVIERLNVLEGALVVKDETVIAVLRNPEIENALAEATSMLAVRRAARGYAEVHLAAHTLILEQRLVARQAVAEQEAAVAIAKAALAEAESAVAAADAAREAARVEVEAQDSLASRGAGAPVVRAVAQQHLHEADATREQRRASRAKAAAEGAKAEALLALAREGEEHPRELEAEVREHTAELAQAQAEEGQAEVTQTLAQANVDRLTVKAPVSGVVMRLLAPPGSVAGPMEQMRALPAEVASDSVGNLDLMVGGICLLYDPAHLQVRVRVKFASLAGLVPGTDADVELDVLHGRRLKARVLRLFHEADVQNNSLLVKVGLLETDPLLEPEMNAMVRFHIPRPKEAQGPSVARFLVPASALVGDAVFLFDPRGSGHARRVPVLRVGEREGVVEVEGALGLSSKVILDPAGLADGDRVKEGS